MLLDVNYILQDDYHYKTTWYSHVPLDLVQFKDSIVLSEPSVNSIFFWFLCVILKRACWSKSRKRSSLFRVGGMGLPTGTWVTSFIGVRANGLNSLIRSIQFQRPDLLPARHTQASPISLNPPHGFFDSMAEEELLWARSINLIAGGIIPDVGQLMFASFPSSAEMVDVSPENQWYDTTLQLFSLL